MASSQKIILGLPKGSLQDSTFAMMKKADWMPSRIPLLHAERG